MDSYGIRKKNVPETWGFDPLGQIILRATKLAPPVEVETEDIF